MAIEMWQQNSPAGRFLRDHDWVRFLLLIAYMSALAAFATWRVVAVLTTHRAWLFLFWVLGLALCLLAWPTVLGVSAKHPPWGPARVLSRSTRVGVVGLISVIAVFAVVPERTSPVEFWQPACLQLVGSGFWLCFAGLVLVRRVRQRAWRGFSPEEHPLDGPARRT